MDDILLSFLDSRSEKLSKNTFLAYKLDLTSFFEYLEQNGISYSSISEAEIYDYITFLDFYMSIATVTRKLSVLRSFYNYLADTNVVKHSPLDNVKYIPDNEMKEYDFLTKNEIEKLLIQPDAIDCKGIRDKTIIIMLYSMGLRISELLNINIQNVHLDKGMISIVGKSSYRQITLPAGALFQLKSYISNSRIVFLRNRADNDALFLNSSGNRLSRQGVWKILKNYSFKARISKKLSPHTLRNSFIIHKLRENIPPSILGESLGLEDISSLRQLKKQVINNFDNMEQK